MKLATLGELSIEVTPTTDPEILNVDIGCKNRKETISMTTQRYETVDQFCIRLRSMLRSLLNSEPRVLPAEKIMPKEEAEKSWPDQKAAMKKGLPGHA